MARPDGMILYAAQYASLEPAKEDFADIKELHKEKFVGFYDAALFTKEADGKVKIIDTDESGRARGTVDRPRRRRRPRSHLPADAAAHGRWAPAPARSWAT